MPVFLLSSQPSPVRKSSHCRGGGYAGCRLHARGAARGSPGAAWPARTPKTARFEGSMASIKISFFQDKKPQFLRHGNLATPPEFRVNLGLIRCTDQGTVHTCPYSTSNRPSQSLHSTERRRRCLDFSPSAHHTRCPPWWSLCMVIDPY